MQRGEFSPLVALYPVMPFASLVRLPMRHAPHCYSVKFPIRDPELCEKLQLLPPLLPLTKGRTSILIW